MRREHGHTCVNATHGCKGQTRCNAPIIQNYDGWPEAYCSMEEREPWACDECLEAVRCDDCGVPMHLTHDKDCVTLTAKAS